MTYERYMRLAIAKAREGIGAGQTPFGACVVKDGEVITCVHNVVWETMDITAHAEVHAIREACRLLKTIDLSGCSIYSTCEPCPMCFSAIHWARFERVVFGARIADARDSGFNELPISNEEMKKLGGSPVEVIGDFLRAENQEVFRDFMASKDKRVY